MNLKLAIVQAATQALQPKNKTRMVNGLVVRTNLRAGDATAQGAAIGSPGVLSGNFAPIPLRVATSGYDPLLGLHY